MFVSYIYIPVIAFLGYVFLFLSFMAAKKTEEISAFIFSLVCGILWTGGSIGMRAMFWPGYKVWFHISILGLFILSYALLVFMVYFTNSKKTFLLKVWPVLVLAMIVINFKTGMFLKAPEIEMVNGQRNFVYSIDMGVIVCFLVCGGIIANIIWVIVKGYKKDVLLQKQMGPIILGIFVIFISQMFLAFPTLNSIPIDLISALFMAMCMGYSLYKKRLFKLTLLVSKSVCHVATGIMSILCLVNFIYEIQYFVSKYITNDRELEIIIIAISFMCMTMVCYYILTKFIDKIFVKESNLKTAALNEYGRSISNGLYANTIITRLIDIINKIAKVECIYVFILNGNEDYYEMNKSSSPLDDRSIRISVSNPIVEQLNKDNNILLLDELKSMPIYKSLWEKEKKQIEEMGTNLFLPLKFDNKLEGIVAISKVSNKGIYTMDELGFLTSIASITSIAVKNSRLYKQMCVEAMTDELTGLLNRKYFYKKLEKEVEFRNGSSLALVSMNIDDFKLYNELYGRKEADEALKRIANIIKMSVGDKGYAGRPNGKEFGIILPNYDMLSAKILAENIRDQVYNINMGEECFTIKALTFSCGISSIPYAASTVDELIHYTGMAVYQVKRSGKNGILLSTGINVESNSKNSTKSVKDRPSVYNEYASSIFALTAAIDAKDHYTFDHSKNVAYYATGLGEAYGLNEDTIEIIYEAALLHDIGKIGIPESILNKKGRLNDEEYEIMKGHVESSVNIIRHLPSLDYVVPAVLGHHERYDGKGYPRRISGKNIPLGGRVLCIADTFDAIISTRSYKKPLSVEYALSEIEKGAGTQFDPELATLFVKCVRDERIIPVKK
ncbi:MAG: diguanylate cyclase [Anaerovoracaceae bacterium]